MEIFCEKCENNEWKIHRSEKGVTYLSCNKCGRLYVIYEPVGDILVKI